MFSTRKERLISRAMKARRKLITIQDQIVIEADREILIRMIRYTAYEAPASIYDVYITEIILALIAFMTVISLTTGV